MEQLDSNCMDSVQWHPLTAERIHKWYMKTTDHYIGLGL